MPNPTPRPQRDAATQPVQEEVRFLIAHANVYVNRSTGELELGARVYRSAAAADQRRQRRACRPELAFVAVLPISAAVPESVRLAVLTASARLSGQAPSVTPDENPVDDAEGGDDFDERT